jgi:uncharacterized membrane protein YgcG
MTTPKTTNAAGARPLKNLVLERNTVRILKVKTGLQTGTGDSASGSGFSGGGRSCTKSVKKD